MDEYLLKELHLSATREQTCTKLTEHRKAKARIAQFERKRVLPINVLLNCFCGLSIGQPFNELENTDQSQTPGRLGWLPTGGE